jgi:hypothetical protein
MEFGSYAGQLGTGHGVKELSFHHIRLLEAVRARAKITLVSLLQVFTRVVLPANLDVQGLVV